MQTTKSNSKPNINKLAKLKYDETRNLNFILLPEKIVKLNGTANAILGLCDGTKTISEIIELLEKKFSVDAIEKDVMDFISDAKNHGWITI